MAFSDNKTDAYETCLICRAFKDERKRVLLTVILYKCLLVIKEWWEISGYTGLHGKPTDNLKKSVEI